jgi:hypothetical protein
MARRIQAPGIEINEIDYSSYETSESLVNTTAFIMGFADKGTDYATRYVSNMNNYVKMFGTPHTEAETYLYNATNEIISKGGNVYVSKLPYDNNSLNKYSYVDYTIDTTLNLLSSPYDIVCNYKYGNVIMKDFLLYINMNLSVPIPLLETEGLLRDDINYNEKNIEIEETDDIIHVSDEIPRTMYSFCDRYDINLYLIEDFKDFVLNSYNFTE